MKRFWLVFLVFAAFFFAFQVASVVSADGSLFKRVGAELKSECEKSLEARAAAVKNTFLKIPDDVNYTSRYVAKPGMMRLEARIKSFDKTKKDCDNQLKLYGLTTETELDPVYRKVVDVYFLRDEMDGRSPKDFFYGDSQNETLRRIFAERFGIDVKIWRGVNKAGWARGVLLVLAFLVCLMFLVCWYADYFRFRWVVCAVLFWFYFFILPI